MAILMKYSNHSKGLNFRLLRVMIVRPIFLFASWLVGKISQLWIPPSMRSFIYGTFAKTYQIDQQEMAEPFSAYPNFQSFFTRKIKREARSFDHPSHQILCPADGMLTAQGKMNGNKVVHCKGVEYSLADLSGDGVYQNFVGGVFFVIYLAPKNYHRFHLPVTAKLSGATLIPGNLLSVAPSYVHKNPQVYVENRRVVCLFAMKKIQKPMLMIMVGALNVGSILLRRKNKSYLTVKDKQVKSELLGVDYERGEELGMFSLGSTIILFFPEKVIDDNSLVPLQKESRIVQVGQPLAEFWQNR